MKLFIGFEKGIPIFFKDTPEKIFQLAKSISRKEIKMQDIKVEERKVSKTYETNKDSEILNIIEKLKEIVDQLQIPIWQKEKIINLLDDIIILEKGRMKNAKNS